VFKINFNIILPSTPVCFERSFAGEISHSVAAFFMQSLRQFKTQLFDLTLSEIQIDSFHYVTYVRDNLIVLFNRCLGLPHHLCTTSISYEFFVSSTLFLVCLQRLVEVDNIRMQSMFLLTTEFLFKVQSRNIPSRTFSARSFFRSEGWTYIQMGPTFGRAATLHWSIEEGLCTLGCGSLSC
jgi:hypothetical protein